MKTKKYPGFSGLLHDSESEAKASFPLAALGFLQCNKRFATTFKDSEGTSFYACPDFHHARYNVYLEWKDSKLNGVRTKATSESQLSAQLMRRGGFNVMNDFLKYGWNHSRNKQAIVQATYTPDRFIVCFATAPPFSEALAYLTAGVVFCTLSSLPSFLGYVRLKQFGLSVGFSLDYTLTDEATNHSHAAGYTYGPV